MRKHPLGRRALRPYYAAKFQRIKAPTRMFFEPTSICNFACPKCPYPTMDRPGAYVDLEKYERFLTSWARDIGDFESIEFTGAGEVLVYKDFPELVRITSRAMPSTKLMTTSNLSLMKPEIAKELLAAGLRTWQVSLDSIDDAEFKEFIGHKKFSVDRILNNLRMLWQAMQDDPSDKNYLAVLAHRPYDDRYEQEMARIEDAVRSFTHSVQKSPYQSLQGRKSDGLYQLSEKKLYNKQELLPCGYVWSDLTVVCDGTVRVCCSDMFDSKISFGNVFENTPTEIVQNLARREYQAKMLAGKWDELYLCKDCHAPRA